MTNDVKWKPGDRIVHRGKPEWGVGAVTAAVSAMHEGKPCQRLTVRFENSGLKTLTTALAQLKSAKPGSGAAASVDVVIPRPEADFARANPSESAVGVFEQSPPESGDPREDLRTLPEEATDPFKSLESRILATLALYQFDGRGRGLLTWASALTGLSDPLSRLNRHELEVAFGQFQILLDRHLGNLLQQAAKNRVNVEALLRDAPRQAHQALQRANRRR